MDYPVVTIEPIALNWWLVCIPFYLAVAALVGHLLVRAFLKKRQGKYDLTYRARDNWEGFQLLLVVLSVIFALVGVGSVTLIASWRVETLSISRILEALAAEHGYTDFYWDYDNDRFIASTADGQYISGRLGQVDTNTYQVVPYEP